MIAYMYYVYMYVLYVHVNMHVCDSMTVCMYTCMYVCMCMYVHEKCRHRDLHVGLRTCTLCVSEIQKEDPNVVYGSGVPVDMRQESRRPYRRLYGPESPGAQFCQPPTGMFSIMSDSPRPTYIVHTPEPKQEIRLYLPIGLALCHKIHVFPGHIISWVTVHSLRIGYAGNSITFTVSLSGFCPRLNLALKFCYGWPTLTILGHA